ncbi:MAG: molybdenum cofactor guanylyltransferase [Acidobacteriota bacterium]|nr:molybdenum cofactor guanylyltransferase [Acidobacteriota bacterium]
MDSIEGFILVGGESRRMGTDKSRLMLEGESFVERVARELAAVTASVSIVGNNTAEIQINLPIGVARLPDVYPRWGALGGVHAALSASRSDWAMVVACDFPFVTRDLFRRLAGLREDFEAVAPIQSDLIPQPLCTLYRVQACLAQAEHLINSGERKPIALLQSVRTRWVPFGELTDLTGSAHFFDNINTPEDYAQANEETGGITKSKVS